MTPEYRDTDINADFDEAVQLPRMREAVERTRNMEEPEAISAAALTEKPIS